MGADLTPPRKDKAQLKRVTELYEAALVEKANTAGGRRVRVLDAGVEAPIGAAPDAGHTATASCQRPKNVPCAGAYDAAHSTLCEAACLVLDTETSSLWGCVLDIGWVLANANGKEFTSYTKLWSLPLHERIHPRAFNAHRISESRLCSEGVDPRLELGELFALIASAMAAGVLVVAHNAAFDVGRLNHTAVKHKLKLPPLLSAYMLCTMHKSAKHCGLRKKGNKALKAPSNEELFQHFFKRKPAGQLHRALPDCRVTLACFVQGRKQLWW